MAIYVTGDLHGEIGRLSTRNFPEQKNLTKSDYVIVLGDFGMLWSGDKSDKYRLDWLNDRSFTTLFIDGNHENFDLLNGYDIYTWNGGQIHILNDSVIHLCRGQVFSLQGRTFFTFGGAESHDTQDGILISRHKIGRRTLYVDVLHKVYPVLSVYSKDSYKVAEEKFNKAKHGKLRELGKSWWSEELPNENQLISGINNLNANNYSIDYILTHCAPSNIISNLNIDNNINYLTDYLMHISNKTRFSSWYCGHYHLNQDIGKFKIRYDIIERIV